MKLHHKNPFIKQALEVLAPLSLDNEVHPDKIRLNDAANYLAKVLHEENKDDPTADILEHLGVAALENDTFLKGLAAALAAPKPDEAITERLRIEALCKYDPMLVKQYKDKLKKWAVDDIDELAAG